MSEPIQLEWEPAEWPEKQPKWAGRDRGVRVAADYYAAAHSLDRR